MIYVNGKYCYRDENRKLRRILCNDCANSNFPVVTEEDGGTVHLHTEEGRYFVDREHALDLIEIGPCDHINEGDIVEIDMGNGRKLLRRFARTAKDGSVRFYSDGGGYEGLLSLSWKDAAFRLVCRKENEEKQ